MLLFWLAPGNDTYCVWGGWGLSNLCTLAKHQQVNKASNQKLDTTKHSKHSSSPSALSRGFSKRPKNVCGGIFLLLTPKRNFNPPFPTPDFDIHLACPTAPPPNHFGPGNRASTRLTSCTTVIHAQVCLVGFPRDAKRPQPKASTICQPPGSAGP